MSIIVHCLLFIVHCSLFIVKDGGLVSAQEEAVLGAVGLVRREWRELSEGRGIRFIEEGTREVFEVAPAGPVEVGCVGDLAEETAPFNDDAVDVADAEDIGDPGVFAGGIFMDAGDDLFGIGAVFGRQAIFEVTGDGLEAESFLAGDGEASCPAAFFAAEAESGIEVGEVVDQFVERIGIVFEPGSDGEAIAVGEEADDPAAQGWCAA
jgi:hypothetical protein